MPETPTQLPSTITALQALVAQQMAEKAEQQARLIELERENKRQSARIFTLQEQLNLALARRFAASSEKLSPDQFQLFNEAEVDAPLALGEDEAEGTIDVPAHARKKRGRKPLPDTLPRTEVIYELAGDDLNCMAHARRRFSEAVKAQGRNGQAGKAHQGLAFIQQLTG